MIKQLQVSTVVAIVLFALACARAESDTNARYPAEASEAKDAVVVRARGFEITWRDIDQVLSTAKAADQQDDLPPEAEFHAVEQLIEIQLVLQKATAAEKEEGEKFADRRLDAVKKIFGETEFEHRLKATHMTEADLHRSFFQDETAQRSLTRQLRVNVTDADAKKLFYSHPPGSYDHPPEARIRELLLLTDKGYSDESLPDAVIQMKHRKIFELYKRVQAGEDFAALAREYNEDPISTNTGGVFSFRRDQMQYGDLAFSMKTNQMSGVLTNEDGYFFFKLLEIIPTKKVEFADIADGLKKAMAGDQVRSLAPAYIRRLWKQAGVEILDPKLKAAVTANEAEADAPRTQAVFDSTNATSVKPWTSRIRR